jgi:hypothetical protein
VVSPREALSSAEVAAWDLGAEVELACMEDALDDETAVELAARHRITRW